MTRDLTNIVRTSKRENPYVMIDHRPLNDMNLSWQAKGMLAYLLSKPDDWTVIIADLEKRATNGRDAVKSIMKELEQKGYIERRRIRDPKTGRFSHMETIVYEVPQEHLLNPQTENPLVDSSRENTTKAQLEPTNGFSTGGKSSAGKSAPTNNDLTKNDLSNNYIYARTPAAEPVDNSQQAASHRAFKPPLVDSIESTSVPSSNFSSLDEPAKAEVAAASETPPADPAPIADQSPKPKRQSKTVEQMRRMARNEYPAEFEQFWAMYPRKEAKADAYKAWQQAKQAFELTDEQLTKAAEAYAYDMQRQKTERRFIKLAGGWLRDGRVLDYLDGAATQSGGNDAAAMYERYMRVLSAIEDGEEGAKTS